MDHVSRAAAYETARARDRPVAIETLSTVSVDVLATVDAPTPLDRELTATAPMTLAGKGFGEAAQRALARRQQWMVAEGLAWEWGNGATGYRADMVATLQRREMLRVAAKLEAEIAKSFAEAIAGQKIEGRLVRVVDLVSGRSALIERSRDFTLVPWRPGLENHIGKPVSGILRERGMSWTLGRGRAGPTIS